MMKNNREDKLENIQIIDIIEEIEDYRLNNIEDDSYFTATIDWMSEYCLDITPSNIDKYIPSFIQFEIKNEALRENMVKPSVVSENGDTASSSIMDLFF